MTSQRGRQVNCTLTGMPSHFAAAAHPPAAVCHEPARTPSAETYMRIDTLLRSRSTDSMSARSNDAIMRTASNDAFMRTTSSSLSPRLFTAGCVSHEVRVATWNIAAVNLNPFEYWVTHSDPGYNQLMEGVQDYMDNPGERDVTVDQTFLDTMAQQLFDDMRQASVQNVEEVVARWESDYRHRRIISGFIKDSALGKKRLASMPDRITNTIHTAEGHDVFRPTVVNYYHGDMGTTSKWWAAWRKFMFRTEVHLLDRGKVKGKEGIASKDAPSLILHLLDPISARKYPALTAEEERISIPLQMLCLAIFDAILLHILSSVGKETWEGIRRSLADAFFINKDKQTAAIIQHTYADRDIIFLQEAAGSFVTNPDAGGILGEQYDILMPAILDTKRDQNSIILIRKGFLKCPAVEITAAVLQSPPNSSSIFNPGDVVAFVCMSVSGQPLLIASFHGDTNGLATIPIITAIEEIASSKYPGHVLIIGLDANTYNSRTADYQSVAEFQSFLESRRMSSCWGAVTEGTQHPTTCNARTYLQPQLNKAICSKHRLAKADKNLKDWIVYRGDVSGCRRVTSSITARDNTGSKKYVEDLIFPTTSFPSDHAVVSSVLNIATVDEPQFFGRPPSAPDSEFRRRPSQG